ncbi:MAG: UDP-galactopyranose mutase [Firmicutes bacterium HGW-Firmicutes-7]|nr:MAG: UDP-galactopyranose mutase [Firmicutes bacterium HGW-Firmicutes-7]
MKKFDYLIVGAGLFGCVFANEMTRRGKKCLVIEKRNHIGGNIYTENIENINVHKYGAHIFHTSNKKIWDYINQFADFNHYINSPLANYKGEIYNLPFNMNTFNKMWGVITPAEAREKIREQSCQIEEHPKNLEEMAVSLVGKDIYEKLIEGYTEKQWGRNCKELPPFIIKRLPVRFEYDNNYFNDIYQGIPIGGYTQICEKMLEGTEVQLSVDYFDQKEHFDSLAKTVVYTGTIDRYFDYCYGPLQYRSIRFENRILNIPDNFQGNAVINYTHRDIPYTRIIEHKHFEFGKQEKTVISYEYSDEWNIDKEPYYPINDTFNNDQYAKYSDLVEKETNIIFGGRLGSYKYYDMDKVIESVLNVTDNL